MSECDRCGATIRKGYPIDSAPGMASFVGECCLKDTDEVVDV